MENRNIHLTDMARDLQNDHSGQYRKQLLDKLHQFQKQVKGMPITKEIKQVYGQIQCALDQARIILMEE